MDGLKYLKIKMSTEAEERRAERKRQRELERARQEELNQAKSTSARREIKERYSESRANSSEERRSQSALRQIRSNNETYGEGSALGALRNQEVVDSFYDSDSLTLPKEDPSVQDLYGDNAPMQSGGGANSDDALSGFEEIDVTVCINGTPKSGKILFKQ